MTGIEKIIEERDRTFALMLARAEKAEAENDRLWAVLKAFVSKAYVDFDGGRPLHRGDVDKARAALEEKA